MLLPRADQVSVQSFVGYRGLFNIVCLLPTLLGTFFFRDGSARHDACFHDRKLTPSNPFKIMLLSVATSTIIVAGITLTSPVFIRIGASLLVPVSLWDVVFDGKEPGLLCWLGTLLTILSFLLLNIDWPSVRNRYAITSTGKMEMSIVIKGNCKIVARVNFSPPISHVQPGT